MLWYGGAHMENLHTREYHPTGRLILRSLRDWPLASPTRRGSGCSYALLLVGRRVSGQTYSEPHVGDAETGAMHALQNKPSV